MYDVQQTVDFERWLDELSDRRATAKIAQRIARLRAGLFGDAKFFEAIGELRIDYGPGYRLYFIRRGDVIVILLHGGDKSTQQRDIIKAKRLAREL